MYEMFDLKMLCRSIAMLSESNLFINTIVLTDEKIFCYKILPWMDIEIFEFIISIAQCVYTVIFIHIGEDFKICV